ncbi:MAG TPA: hypothetical protein VF322_07555 [Gammaproteobacteria bacterium]
MQDDKRDEHDAAKANVGAVSPPDDEEDEGPREYASPACYLHELQDDYGLHAHEPAKKDEDAKD